MKEPFFLTSFSYKCKKKWTPCKTVNQPRELIFNGSSCYPNQSRPINSQYLSDCQDRPPKTYNHVCFYSNFIQSSNSGHKQQFRGRQSTTATTIRRRRHWPKLHLLLISSKPSVVMLSNIISASSSSCSDQKQAVRLLLWTNLFFFFPPPIDL